MNVLLPKYLFKYQPLDREFEGGKTSLEVLRDMLIGGSIWYSKPRFFNDPFEIEGIRTRLSANEKKGIVARTQQTMRHQRPPGLSVADMNALVQKVCEERIEEAQAELDLEKNGLLHRCGYISLSRSNDSILLWSHYAASHTGVCLQFRCESDPFFSENGNGRVIEVTYNNDIENAEVELGNADAYFVQLARKAKCWEHEEEFRVFKVPSSQSADDAHGYHKFNPTLIDAIYFGVRTPEIHIEEVKRLVEEAEHEIALFQAKRHSEKLAIQFDQI